jgi:hypothetical protein
MEKMTICNAFCLPSSPAGIFLQQPQCALQVCVREKYVRPSALNDERLKGEKG